MTLTGSDTFTGPTTISAGTLQVGNGGAGEFLGSQTVSIASNSALVFSHSDATTYAGAISGAGNLVQMGAGGNLVLTGSNAYTGNTFVSSGTLQVGNGTSGEFLASPTISNSGALVFNHADLLTYSGAISGPGSLTKMGTGILTLAGVNTYTGSTTLAAGELSVSSTANLPTASPIVFSGGFLQVTGTAMTSMAGYGSVNWSSFNGGFDIANAANTFTLSSPISGGGSLGNLGPGTLVVTASNGYTGGTTIGAGILQVSGSGTLGSGPVADNAAPGL